MADYLPETRNEQRQRWFQTMTLVKKSVQRTACSKGRGGDGPCGYCKQLAEQRVEYSNGELSLSDALDWVWVPKTEAASRDIYFGFDARVELAIERYFDSPEYDGWANSAGAINRRVKTAAEHADRIDAEHVSPHTLRATAATYHAGRGLELLPLMQMFGWAQPSTAEVYIGRNGTNTARQLDSIHST